MSSLASGRLGGRVCGFLVDALLTVRISSAVTPLESLLSGIVDVLEVVVASVAAIAAKSGDGQLTHRCLEEGHGVG